MSQYTSYWLYQRYEQRGDQDPIPTYPNVYSVDADGTMPLVVRREYDEQCGWYCNPPIYQWVTMPITEDYMCGDCDINIDFRWVSTGEYAYFGDYKYEVVKEQYKMEDGEWVDTENESYSNPVRVAKKLEITLDNDDVFYQSCGSDDGVWHSYTKGIYEGDFIIYSNNAVQHSTTYSYNGLPVLFGSLSRSSGSQGDQYYKFVKKVEFGDCVYEIGSRYRFDDSGNPSIWDNDISESGEEMSEFRPYNFCGLGIKELILPDGLRWIGGEMFTDNDIESLSLPPTVESIGYLKRYDRTISGASVYSSSSTFASNKRLRNVNLNEGLKSIGSGDFRNCVSLERIDIPSTVEKMGYDIFNGCSNLKQIVFKGSTPPTLICDGCTGDYARFVLSANSDVYVYVPCGSKSAYENTIDDLPDDRIVEYGGSCGDIPSIPHMVLYTYTIGETTYEVYKSSTSIDSSYDFLQLEDLYPDVITIPSNTQIVGDNAITIPPCNKLIIEGTVANDVIANAKEVVTNSSRVNGTNIEKIVFSSGSTPIIWGLYTDLPYLKEIVIDGNPLIKGYSFRRCYNLTDVYITYIDSLIEVQYDEIPPFYNINPTIHVPCELYEMYKNHSFWSKFNLVRDTDECEQGSYFNIVENTFSSGCTQSLYDFNLSPVYCGDSENMKIKIKNLSKVVFEHVVCGTMGRGTYLSFYLDGVLVYNRPCSSTSSGQAGYVEKYTLDNLPDDGEEHEIMITSNYAGSGRSNYFAVTYN